MEVNHYLIITPGARRHSPNVKLVKGLKGTMRSDSVAIKLNIILPDSIFQKPQLQATIKVKDEDIAKPIINAETLDNIKVAFQQNLGIDMNIHIVQKENKK